MTRLAAITALTIDGDDEERLAAFYSALFDAPVERLGPTHDTLAVRTSPGGLTLVFRTVDDHRRPTWPAGNVPMKMHFELDVDDLAAAERRLLSIGASRPPFQPHRSDGLVVLLDPAGHPFCIAASA